MITLDVPAFLSGECVVAPGAKDFVLRRLSASDYDVLREFRADVVEAIGNPDVIRLMPDEEQYVRECLHQNNLVIGLFDGERLVAFNSASWPTTDQDLRELYIYDFVRPRCLPSASIYNGGLMVNKSHRGRGFQRLLIDVRTIISAHVGRHYHFSTVGLANSYSWRNAMGSGARVIGLYEFTDPRYGETSRLFMYWPPAPKPLGDNLVWVNSLDAEAQRTLLDDGFVGAEFRMLGPIAQLGYRRERT